MLAVMVNSWISNEKEASAKSPNAAPGTVTVVDTLPPAATESGFHVAVTLTPPTARVWMPSNRHRPTLRIALDGRTNSYIQILAA